jgi:hypothetical protein
MLSCFQVLANHVDLQRPHVTAVEPPLQIHVIEHPRGISIQAERHADLPTEVVMRDAAFAWCCFSRFDSQGKCLQALDSSGQIQKRLAS